MDRQKLIDEIRGLQKNQPNFSLEDVQTEIRKEKGSPYNKIVDYDECQMTMITPSLNI